MHSCRVVHRSINKYRGFFHFRGGPSHMAPKKSSISFTCCGAEWSFIWTKNRGYGRRPRMIFKLRKTCSETKRHIVSGELAIINSVRKTRVISTVPAMCFGNKYFAVLFSVSPLGHFLRYGFKVDCCFEIRTDEPDCEVEMQAMMGPIRGVDNLCNVLWDLFLEKKNCDVTLQVQNEEFSAHKLILSSRSKFFSGLFRSVRKSGEPPGVYIITGTEPSVFKDVLCCIYTGQLPNREPYSTLDKCLELYEAAVKYSLEDLKGLAVDVMSDVVSLTNICEIATFGSYHDDQDILDCVTNFASGFSLELLSSSEYTSLLETVPVLAQRLTIDPEDVPFDTSPEEPMSDDQEEIEI